MSIEKTKSRKEITNEVKDTKKDTGKALKDGQKVVDDIKAVAKTAKCLRLGGTSEGNKEVKKNVEKARDVAGKKHEKLGADLKKRGFDRGKKIEKELGKRSNEVGKDIDKLKQATAKLATQESKRQSAASEKAAEQDKKFLGDTKKTQEQQRMKAEADRRKQDNAVKTAKVSFRN